MEIFQVQMDRFWNIMVIVVLVQGCTDASACNYNADASTDDGSCDLPAEGFDCDGNCLSGELVTINMMIHSVMVVVQY